MKKLTFSLFVGASFVALDWAVSFLSSHGAYLFWMLLRNIAWPAAFVVGYLRIWRRLNAWVSLLGLIIGLVIATGAAASWRVEWSSVPIAILSYLVYSASLLPILIVVAVLVIIGIKQGYDRFKPIG